MKFYTLSDVAKIYKVRPNIVFKWVKKGAFPNAFIESEERKLPQWLIPEDDLQNFKPKNRGRQYIENPSRRTIFNRDYRARKSLEKSHGFGEQDFLKIVELEKEGVSAQEIADRFGIRQRLVENMIRRTAIKPYRIKKVKKTKELKRIPKEVLTELYIEKKLPTVEILERFNIGYADLYINLRYWDIPLRSKHAGNLARENQKLLYQLYIEEDLSLEEIADRLNLTVPYIRRKLRQFGIAKSSDVANPN